jgi:hypothetical protein
VTEYLRCLIERCKQFFACLVDHDVLINAVKTTINPRDHLGPKNAGNYIQRRTLIKCLKPATLAYNIHQG